MFDPEEQQNQYIFHPKDQIIRIYWIQKRITLVYIPSRRAINYYILDPEEQ